LLARLSKIFLIRKDWAVDGDGRLIGRICADASSDFDRCCALIGPPAENVGEALSSSGVAADRLVTIARKMLGIGTLVFKVPG